MGSYKFDFDKLLNSSDDESSELSSNSDNNSE